MKASKVIQNKRGNVMRLDKTRYSILKAIIERKIDLKKKMASGSLRKTRQ